MKKIAIIIVSILALSMMMTVAPALAARTPKDDQALIKIVDSTGKGIRNADVYIYQQAVSGGTFAQSNTVTTKGNGLAVISLIDDTYFGTWAPAGQGIITIVVSANGITLSFGPYDFYGTKSLDKIVTMPLP